MDENNNLQNIADASSIDSLLAKLQLASGSIADIQKAYNDLSTSLRSNLPLIDQFNNALDRQNLLVSQSNKNIETASVKLNSSGELSINETRALRDAANTSLITANAADDRILREQSLLEQLSDRSKNELGELQKNGPGQPIIHRSIDDESAVFESSTIFQSSTGAKSSDELPSRRKELEQWSPVIQSIRSGFSGLGSDIHHYITDELIGATSLFQKFVSGVLSGLVSIGEKIAESAIGAGILSLIPGLGTFSHIFSALTGGMFATGGIISEPIFGVGMTTGKNYLMGEAGPERVQPLTSFGGKVEPIVIQIQGESTIRGRDVRIAFQTEKIIYQARGGSL